MNYKVKDFDYYLPLELIAQKPIKPRDHSRLLLLNKETGEIRHQHFYELINYLHPGDLLILNNSKVFPARLIGQRESTGGKIEVLLHRKLNNSELGIANSSPVNIWECLARGRVRPGQIIIFSSGLKGKIVLNKSDYTRHLKFNLSGKAFWQEINKIGEVPLPPYIKRSTTLISDKKNYQTVFADNHKLGSVAAPTAGLHFTKKLLADLRALGIKIEYLTLHVGLGTFLPVKTENIIDHKMHSEFVELGVKIQKAIIATKLSGGRIIAVGTTSCRALESLDWTEIIGNEKNNKKLNPQSLWTDIFIYPGYHFNVVDALITNFHLPKSTLLMLVSALAGSDRINKAYQEAIKQRYRFFSYGDAMFIY